MLLYSIAIYLTSNLEYTSKAQTELMLYNPVVDYSNVHGCIIIDSIYTLIIKYVHSSFIWFVKVVTKRQRENGLQCRKKKHNTRIVWYTIEEHCSLVEPRGYLIRNVKIFTGKM